MLDSNSRYYSEQQLPASQHGSGGIFSLSSVNLNHTGVYTFRAEREFPVTETPNNSFQPARQQETFTAQFTSACQSPMAQRRGWQKPK